VRNFEAGACEGCELFQEQIDDFHNFQGHGRDSLINILLIVEDVPTYTISSLGL
jgi:hypothetical protein